MGAEVEKKEMRGIETMTVQVPWKAILRFSIPLFIGSLFQQIYSMADAVIVGRLVGVKELAGVGATGAMSFLVIGFATGITSGFSVVIAQRAGAGKKEQIRTSVAACGWLCTAVTAVMTLLSTAGADPLLRLMNTPEDIFQYASGYIGIIFGGLGAAIYYNMTAGILRAVGDSRTPLYFLIFSSVLNVVLDLAAVLVFQGGVEGAAWATVLAQLVSAALCHWYAWRKYPDIWPERRHWTESLSQGWQHLRIGLPMALQFSVTAVGIMILQAYLNGFGSAVIAGYTAAGKVENLVTQPFTTLAAAMEVYCGQNYGAGRPDRIRQGIASSLKMGAAAAAGMLALNVCFGRQMIRLFLDPYDPVIVEYGYTYLVIIGVFSMALCALQIVRSSLQGMGEALVPMAGGVLELAARWGGCVLLMPLGYAGICFSTPLAWILALALLLIYYKKIQGGKLNVRQEYSI